MKYHLKCYDRITCETHNVQHLNNNVVLEVKKEAGVSPVINTNSTNLLGLKK